MFQQVQILEIYNKKFVTLSEFASCIEVSLEQMRRGQLPGVDSDQELIVHELKLFPRELIDTLFEATIFSGWLRGKTKLPPSL